MSQTTFHTSISMSSYLIFIVRDCTEADILEKLRNLRSAWLVCRININLSALFTKKESDERNLSVFLCSHFSQNKSVHASKLSHLCFFTTNLRIWQKLKTHGIALEIAQHNKKYWNIGDGILEFKIAHTSHSYVLRQFDQVKGECNLWK